ncbi:PAS domain S-box protein [Thiomicrorhabdus sp. 6S2-11]|uniref:PAS domain S-box protein n=1 Tax=Thiomicrorhabdus marina TaxID=2818442 RepID=A0ABS3Q3Y2_9GAMM|nr:methyl-accepting chemotaxis protein [Thiomicrorhabdus marina]MBO1926664.1 PAS domain S-box protein [Thiomicrorhabdus marina]
MFVSAKQHQAAILEKQQLQNTMDALQRSMAIIEFDLQGNILTANDNFLNTVGYQLSEIQNQKHAIFMPPEQVDSIEYQQFWERLRKGEFFSGQFMRTGKNNKRIWIEATYNPILDENGKPYKVVKFATDITVRKEQEIEAEAKLHAIDQSYAVIEFTPDGTILDANANFCSTLNYDLDEIRQQKHSMFVDNEYASSNEYKQFWIALQQGEEQIGSFKRIGKNGKEVWIQAAYIPVAHDNQLPHKVIKIATDITEQKQQEMNLARMVHEAGEVLQAMASGDLTLMVNGDYNGDLLKLKDDLNHSINNLADAMGEINQSVRSVSNSASEVSSASMSLSDRTQQTANSVEQTVSVMQETMQQVQQTRNKVQEARQSSREQQALISAGNDLMGISLQSMQQIKDSSEEITNIVALIDGIAFQTNLLALNAAVEAARAGEHGRGFAVVAGEVRNLAQKSADAAKEIKHLIDQAVEQSQSGVEVVGRLADNLNQIRQKSTEVSDIIDTVGSLAEHQTESVGRIGNEISNIDSSTQENAAFVEQTSATAESLSGQAHDVLQVLQQFQIATSHRLTHH